MRRTDITKDEVLEGLNALVQNGRQSLTNRIFRHLRKIGFIEYTHRSWNVTAVGAQVLSAALAESIQGGLFEEPSEPGEPPRKAPKFYNATNVRIQIKDPETGAVTDFPARSVEYGV